MDNPDPDTHAAAQSHIAHTIPRARALTPRAKALALLAIVTLAAFLRLYRIGSLPPGDGYDPAWYGVDALQILHGHLPVYLPTNIGREALFSYIVALSVALFGIGPQAIHIASAFAGVLTVPATFLAAEALFAREKGLLQAYGGLVAAAMLTVSFWHQQWSRYGVRAILVPLATALVIWALARAVRRRRRGDFVLAGALLGLSLYTYQSARVLPALVVAAFVVLTWSERGSLRAVLAREALGQLALLAGTAAIVFAPMGIYLATHPGLGNERIDQTWAISPELSLHDNVLRLRNEAVDMVKVLAVEGDDEPLFNLAGRPALNPFLLGLLALGLLIALVTVRRTHAAILLLWVPAMSITALLTLGGQPTKRALGALPALAILIAIGALTPLDLVRDKRRERTGILGKGLAGLWSLALVAGFAYSGVATFRDYFLLWGADPNLFTHFEAGRDAIGQYAGTLPPEERVYSSPEMPDHPAIVFNSGARPGMKGYNGRLCIVYPEVSEQPTTYIIVQHEDRLSLDRLARIYPTGEALNAGPDFYGQPYFTAYRVPAGAQAQLTPAHLTPATFGEPGTALDLIRLLGYDLSAETVHPGDTVELTLSYGALAPIERGWVVFVHLLGPDNPATGNTLWAQDDSEPCRTFYPTWTWAPGEIVRDTYTLAIAADAPPGPYTLEMGFYAWPDMARLTTKSGPDGSEQITFVLGQIPVE